MEKKEVSMQKQEEIPGSHREVGNVQYNPHTVKRAIEGKNKFLVDVIMALFKTPNMILAQLKAS